MVARVAHIAPGLAGAARTENGILIIRIFTLLVPNAAAGAVSDEHIVLTMDFCTLHHAFPSAHYFISFNRIVIMCAPRLLVAHPFQLYYIFRWAKGNTILDSCNKHSINTNKNFRHSRYALRRRDRAEENYYSDYSDFICARRTVFVIVVVAFIYMQLHFSNCVFSGALKSYLT